MAERRTPRRFEPPPWEQNEFDVNAPSEAAQAADSELDAVLEEALNGGAIPRDHEEQAETPRTTGVEPGPRETANSAAMIEMLARLAEEEPDAEEAISTLAVVSAAITVAIGGVMIIWGMTALSGLGAKGRPSDATRAMTGLVGGGGIAAFGLFFVVIGIWMVYRILKRQGVIGG